MRKSGNGEPITCLENLIATYKTECPMSRGKGIDARLIDSPAAGFEEIDENITDLAVDYEPRIGISDLEITMDEEGRFDINIYTGGTEEDVV